MAGAGDRAFRETCALFGVDVFCTEMISAKAVYFGDKKTQALARIGEGERPCAIQLFGSDPEIMAFAARHLTEESRPDGIDLNFGCPVPKIVNNGEGSALMRDKDRIYHIVKSVKDATSLPVSVKIRAGWSEDEINAVSVAQVCEKAGAARIAVHARTRMDFYRDGTVKWDVIADVKRAVSVPVIGNGDIRCGEDAERMLAQTRCDGVMIGRAAVGSPWVFARIRAHLEGTEAPVIEKKDVIRAHLEKAFLYKPASAGREMRMHMAHYLKGFRGAAALRDRACRAAELEDYLSLLDEIEE